MEGLNKKLKELKSILSDAMITQIDLDLKIKLACKLNEAIDYTSYCTGLKDKTGYNNIEDTDPNWTSYNEGTL